MIKKVYLALGLSTLLTLLTTGSVSAQPSTAQLDKRLSRVEQSVNSGSLLELLQRLENLQSEVSQIRGELEEQAHGLNQMRQRQRELYIDVDRRMQRLEAGGMVAAPAPQASPGADTSRPDEPPTGGTAPATGPAPATDIDPVKEQSSYQTAFNLLKEGRYKQAGKAFDEFVKAYPGGRYADNAQYWLGETYYVTRQFPAALEEFQNLANNHPESPKLSHALLKIGYIKDELGNKSEAEAILNQLIEQFPKTTAARLARDRLRRIRLENN